MLFTWFELLLANSTEKKDTGVIIGLYCEEYFVDNIGICTEL